MRIGQNSWAERIAEANTAFLKEQADILSEVQQLKSGCTDPAQLARIAALETRAVNHMRRLTP